KSAPTANGAGCANGNRRNHDHEGTTAGVAGSQQRNLLFRTGTGPETESVPGGGVESHRASAPGGISYPCGHQPGLLPFGGNGHSVRSGGGKVPTFSGKLYRGSGS